MIIKELINKYLSKNYKLKDAQNLAAEEIILRKIASSDMADHVTLKGGIVMYNIANNNRRATQDIDFDLIRYSIDKESIALFINRMNYVDDGFLVSIKGGIEDLHQEDYQGVRLFVEIRDKNNDRLSIKLDIGVHAYLAIEQKNVVFNFESNSESVSVKVNPVEQIVAEKLLALARLGAISTRYKDLYDLYYLINECKASSQEVYRILSMFFEHTKKKPNNLFELQNVIDETLNDEAFAKEATNSVSKWIDMDYKTIKDTINDFINCL